MPEQAQLEHLEQAAGAGADDDDFGADRARWRRWWHLAQVADFRGMSTAIVEGPAAPRMRRRGPDGQVRAARRPPYSTRRAGRTPPAYRSAPRADSARTRPTAGTALTSNAELHARRQQAVPRGVSNSLAVYAERASNAELWDVEGRRYIDFASGISVLNTGHVHPKVQAGHRAAAGEVHAYLLPGHALRELRGAGRALNALAPGPDAEKDHLPHHRRGGGRERDQDRALPHRAPP